MKYGTFIFFDVMAENRKDRPDMNNLPELCCANCEEWCPFSDGCGAGTCFEHSCGSPDGDSVFTWADDLCERHAKEVLDAYDQ